jgi:hypothetical protein
LLIDPIDPKSVTSMTPTNAKGTECDDTALVCPWCGQTLRLRRRGSAGRFCCAAHRTAYWTACRKWAERAVALGILSVADLKADTEACTPFWGGNTTPPCPEIASTDRTSPEPLQRFVVEVPQALIKALAFRDFEIVPYERDDLIAIMGALVRLRHKPTTTKTPEGVTVLSF